MLRPFTQSARFAHRWGGNAGGAPAAGGRRHPGWRALAAGAILVLAAGAAGWLRTGGGEPAAEMPGHPAQARARPAGAPIRPGGLPVHPAGEPAPPSRFPAASGGGTGGGTATARPAGPDAAPKRYTFRDDHGEPVTVPAAPRRVACLAPELCAILTELLPAQAIVPVPVAAGGNEVERLQAIRPDLVLLPEVTRTPGLARQLRRAGLPAATVRLRRLNELPGAAARIGTWIGRPSRGRALADSYGKRLRRVAGRTVNLGLDERPAVLVLVWNEPPVVAGPASPVAELVWLAGGRLVPQTAGGGPVRGWSAGGRPRGRALARAWQWLAGPASLANPFGGGAWISGDALLRGAGIPSGTRVLTPLLRPGHVRLQAGDPKGFPAVYHLPPDQILGAGPAALTGLERLAVWLHPRRFPDLTADPPARLGAGR